MMIPTDGRAPRLAPFFAAISSPDWSEAGIIGTAFPTASAKASQRSSDDIGQQRVLELGDEVFERELAFLQPLQVQIVRGHLWRKSVDGFVEIAMLGLESRDSLLDGFNVEVHGNFNHIKKR